MTVPALLVSVYNTLQPPLIADKDLSRTVCRGDFHCSFRI